MLFKDAINTPCGLRYMYQELELQSGAGRRLLLDEVMMVSAEEIEEHYGKLREFHSLVDDRTTRTLQVKLARLRDVSGTCSRIASGAVLDDVELFEVKNLLLLASEVREVLKGAGIEKLFVPVLGELPLRLLDPQGQRVPSFHVYDCYSDELAALRLQIRQNPPDRDELLKRSFEIEVQVRKKLSEELRGHATVIWLTLETLAEADLLLAQSLQIKKMGLVFPEMSDDGKTVYEKMFHPQVAAQLAERGGEFQPVDISFGDGPVTIIGANMGGKTVVLKTAGMCQLLFQFGFGIPARTAKIDIKKDVLFCIGEEDRSLQGLSSFGAEITCVDRIIKASREGRCILAIVDEPARTTNPVEGTALVEALLKVMDGTEADLLLTTHYNLKRTPGRKLRVKGLDGGKMNYSLEETAEGEVPHEAVAVAESLGADVGWMEETKKILDNLKI